MLGSISNIRSGLALDQQRLEASAHNTANLATAPAAVLRVQAQESSHGGVEAVVVAGSGPASPIAETVEQLMAVKHFAALEKALQTQEEMVGLLLDLEA